MTTTTDPIADFDTTTFDAFMDKSGKRLMNLKWRWMDERDYEDFAEYQKVVRELVTASGLTFKSWTKRGKLTVTDENQTEIAATFAASGSVTIKWTKAAH
jgi:hypothetical protein